MVRFILILCFSFSAHADFFGFGSDSEKSKIPDLVEKLQKLEMKDGPEFEEVFNQTIKSIENAVEEEKLFCSGEIADTEGKTLPAAKKPLCMRELKKRYVESMNAIFEVKKKYLAFIHQRQMNNLTEIQKKINADIEKSF